jgi:CMP-N,N'-diacetyllegionaminic acid synthase
MILEKRILAVVPARGGSKGIPMKNLRSVGGRSLVALVGDVVALLPEIDRAVISTDHEEIARVGQDAGLDAPFRRPEEISGDRIGDWDVLVHALEATEANDGMHYDIIVMLQPTSPLRRAEDVRGTIKMMVEGNYDAVWTVSETDIKSHPLKQLVVHNGDMEYWDSRGAQIIARQQLTPVYHRNGVAYAISRECLLVQKTIKGKRTGAYVVEGEHVSIDTEKDLELVALILSHNKIVDSDGPMLAS